jgi:hypothetical protein
VSHRLAGVAEDNGGGRFNEAQQIHRRHLALLRVDAPERYQITI